MELLVNVTVSFAEPRAAYAVCWQADGGAWKLLSTHNMDGSNNDTLVVSPDGIVAHGAPEGLLVGERCCDGLHIGELCIPAALVLVMWLLLVLSCLCTCFAAFAARKQRLSDEAANCDPHGEHKAGYDDFEMEDATRTLVSDGRDRTHTATIAQSSGDSDI